MKFTLAFAAVLAVAAGQLNPFSRPPYPFPAVTTPRPYQPAIVSSPRPIVTRVNADERNANTISYESDSSPDGGFVYSFATDNGIGAQARGTPRDFGGNPPVVPVVIEGSYSYTSPEGVPIVITYIADENGYRAQGDSIPTPPPIPEAILRSLEFNARNNPQKK